MTRRKVWIVTPAGERVDSTRRGSKFELPVIALVNAQGLAGVAREDGVWEVKEEGLSYDETLYRVTRQGRVVYTNIVVG